MYEILDKLVLFLGCITLYLIEANNSFFVIPVIISIVLSCIFLYYENLRIRFAGSLLFAFLCIFIPHYIIFLPLLLYDIQNSKYQYGVLTVPFLFAYNYFVYTPMTLSFTLILLVIGYLLKYKTDRLNKLNSEYNELRDSSVQMSMLLQQKNQNLLKNQDYEINLATLNERNRISKDIHDNIGHLLSRSLLQVGALLTVTKDDLIREGLSALKVSLSGGMDQIRSSIHQMYDESIDLYVQVEKLVKDFTFCPITYDYDIKNPPALQLKHSMIAITKEALNNIIVHSNATKVTIMMREHPAMYQLIIKDNGTIDDNTKRKHLSQTIEKGLFGDGMGLRNIHDRVKSFDGNINVSLEDGLQIFITIPKRNTNL